jgi:23S rRNA pseudouridine2605 synthase
MPGRPGVLVARRAEDPAPATSGRRNNPASRPERRPERRPEQRPARAEPAAVPEAHEPQRIARLLARAGVASRRDIERMIEEGRIALNGEVITTPATIVKSLAGITVNGLTVSAMEPTRLFRFHKPGGVLTTARDPGGRPTIYDILPPSLPRTVAVGRLDMNTEGLLLLTTDGALKRALELPSSGVPRSYRVRAYGEIHQRVLEDLIDGITIEGVHYGPIDAGIERRTGRNLWIGMTLTEGKNREIRRVLEHLGLQVSRLIRTRYGPIHLDDLPPRGVDEVPPQLVAQLMNVLKRGPEGA